MVDDSSQPRSPEEEVPHVRHEHFSIVYSNWVQPARSPWDITLSFGQLGAATIDKPAVIDMVNVVMTPQLAKALIGSLALAVREYEQDNGEIPIPGIIKRMTDERTARKSSVSPSASTSPSPSASPSPEPPEDKE